MVQLRLVKSPHLPMSIADFHRLKWHAGWKYEYWSGMAHISPKHLAVTTSVAVAPRSTSVGNYDVRAVTADDLSGLQEAYFHAFDDTVAYCDWPSENIAKDSLRTLEEYFAGVRGVPHVASKLAYARGDRFTTSRLAGAALVVTEVGHPMLDLLFVIPSEQRRGLATALVSLVMNDLYASQQMVLRSRYDLADDLSRDWHRRFGFIEEPGWRLTNAYLQCARHDLARLEEEGGMTARLRDSLVEECRRLEEQLATIDEIATAK